MQTPAFTRAETAGRYIAEQTYVRPGVGLVLGSGLGAFADELGDALRIPYSEIPHFPAVTVAGHRGQLVVGEIEGAGVAVMQGRVHGYEGYSPEEVTFPVRVLRLLGAETLVVTNAAGAVRENLRQGELVLISDHINLTGRNPLAGANDERFGPRFFDMTEAYSRRLRTLAHEAAAADGVKLTEGVYVGVSGPSYETPAEIRAFRTLGADLVGMSTVHEVIVARHMGMEVLGISCVTNMAAGILAEPINHDEVMATGVAVQEKLGRVLQRVLAKLGGRETTPARENNSSVA